MAAQASDAQTAEQKGQAQPGEIVYGDAAYREAYDKERRQLYKTYAVPEVKARPQKTGRLAK